jgi:hypothetical protein
MDNFQLVYKVENSCNIFVGLNPHEDQAEVVVGNVHLIMTINHFKAVLVSLQKGQDWLDGKDVPKAFRDAFKEEDGT